MIRLWISSHSQIFHRNIHPAKLHLLSKMKWLFSDVIFLNSWWKRWEIYSCWGKDTVLNRVIHQTRLLLAKMKWFICDVILNSHLIARRRNNVQDYWSNTTALAVQMNWFLCNVISLNCLWERREIEYSSRKDMYLTEVLTKRDCC